jgi:hypothetical protein
MRGRNKAETDIGPTTMPGRDLQKLPVHKHLFPILVATSIRSPAALRERW